MARRVFLFAVVTPLLCPCDAIKSYFLRRNWFLITSDAWLGGEAGFGVAQQNHDTDVGAFAAIDQAGYLNVVLKADPSWSLRFYIARVVEYSGGQLVDKDKLESLISLYMEGKGPSSLEQLQALLFSEGVANGMVAMRTGATLPRIPVPKLSDSRRHVQILGLFNSGTNLLQALLQQHFGDQVLVHSDYKPMAKFWLLTQEDVCYADEYPNRQTCSLWKHADLEAVKRRAPKRFRQFEADDVVAVAMIRNPLAWLQGIRKAPYEFGREESSISQDDWLNRSYEFHEDWYGGLPREGYSSLSAAWNSHTHSYDTLSQYGFRRNLALRYEDLVMNLEKSLQAIADVLELPTPTSMANIEDSAKAGDSHGHEEAKRLIEGNVYENMFSQSDKHKACVRLDMDMMREHGYNSCDEELANAAMARLAASVSTTTLTSASTTPSTSVSTTTSTSVSTTPATSVPTTTSTRSSKLPSTGVSTTTSTSVPTTIDKRVDNYFDKRAYNSIDSRVYNICGKRVHNYFDERVYNIYGKRVHNFFDICVYNFHDKRVNNYFDKRAHNSSDKRVHNSIDKRFYNFCDKRVHNFIDKRVYNSIDTCVHNFIDKRVHNPIDKCS